MLTRQCFVFKFIFYARFVCEHGSGDAHVEAVALAEHGDGYHAVSAVVPFARDAVAFAAHDKRGIFAEGLVVVKAICAGVGQVDRKGSSNKITLGFGSRAQQILSFCCMPLLSSLPSLFCLSSSSIRDRRDFARGSQFSTR